MAVVSTLVFVLVFVWLVLSGLHFLKWKSKHSPKSTLAKYPSRSIFQLMLFFPVSGSPAIDSGDYDILTDYRRKVWIRYLFFVLMPILIIVLCVRILSIRIDQTANEIQKDSQELERRIKENTLEKKGTGK